MNLANVLEGAVPRLCLLDRFESATGRSVQSGRISRLRYSAVKVGGSGERTDRVCESGNKRTLGKMLFFRTTQVRLAHLMQHLANHSTYHRGQVALMMRQLDAEPVATDFHVFLAEGRREAAAAR